MNETIRQLEPKVIWNNFSDLNAVPRPSKKEEKAVQFIKSFGEKLGLPTKADEMGNVIITKPATKGMEKKVTIVLQGHLDMVHQKNASTNFDFATQGIQMELDGDWVKAKGTTLGADNGIGVATIMSILASKDIPHPAIEALFTVDEETGMTGALALKPGLLHGEILLNLDTEDDHELTIGCAGGLDVTASGMYGQVPPKNKDAFKLTVSGLTGGHSGMDIHKGRGNANKLMNRLLFTICSEMSLEIASIDGGSLRNAIPRESVAGIVVPDGDVDRLKKLVKDFEKTVKEEYHYTDPNLSVALENAQLPAKVLDGHFQSRFLRCVYACPNGIYRMSPDIPGLVQSSNNVARILVKDGNYQVQCLTRSSVDSEKADLHMAIASCFQLCGADVTGTAGYPGWTPHPDSPIVKLMSSIYKERYKESPNVDAVHAGLECGIIGKNYPNMQMISFGPNITGAHSPDEKVQVSSVQKFWDFLLDVLQRIPDKSKI
jgi:dipeptidase D